MDASYWALSSGEIRPPGGGGGGGRGCGWRRNKPLDPNAKAWSPEIHGAPEEDRGLFLTFSNGHPITELEIARFFTHKYGDCLERVYVHWPQPKDYRETNITPQFGKVTFKACCIPLVMTHCGKRQIKFMVYGKPLWCKKFDPKKTQAFKRNWIS